MDSGTAIYISEMDQYRAFFRDNRKRIEEIADTADDELLERMAAFILSDWTLTYDLIILGQGDYDKLKAAINGE